MTYMMMPYVAGLRCWVRELVVCASPARASFIVDRRGPDDARIPTLHRDARHCRRDLVFSTPEVIGLLTMPERWTLRAKRMEPGRSPERAEAQRKNEERSHARRQAKEPRSGE